MTKFSYSAVRSFLGCKFRLLRHSADVDDDDDGGGGGGDGGGDVCLAAERKKGEGGNDEAVVKEEITLADRALFERWRIFCRS